MRSSAGRSSDGRLDAQVASRISTGGGGLRPAYRASFPGAIKPDRLSLPPAVSGGFGSPSSARSRRRMAGRKRAPADAAKTPRTLRTEPGSSGTQERRASRSACAPAAVLSSTSRSMRRASTPSSHTPSQTLTSDKSGCSKLATRRARRHISPPARRRACSNKSETAPPRELALVDPQVPRGFVSDLAARAFARSVTSSAKCRSLGEP